MTAPSILLVDSNAADWALSMILLQREMPRATVTAAADAMAFADALAGHAPDVAIVAAELAWAHTDEIIATIKRRSPASAVVLLGHESDIVARALNPGLACDGIVRKSSAGFVGLTAIVTEVLQRTRRAATSAAADTQEPKAVERSHQEMRDIAQVFAHDLQEPLQQIVRLARSGQGGDDDRLSARSLQRVIECAGRASGMLDGMIEYLSVTGRDAAPAPIDLNVCLTKAIDNLRSVIDESHAEISAAHLPTAVGDEHQFVHLFQNLLSNAIKFRGRERPAVAISVEAQRNRWLLVFRDNGIGIAQPFLQRIFTMGQRLHTREEYPGTGIGLALCRRIVERHGGRIWAESGGSGGSTFYVLLSQAPPARESAIPQASPGLTRHGTLR